MGIAQEQGALAGFLAVRQEPNPRPAARGQRPNLGVGSAEDGELRQRNRLAVDVGPGIEDHALTDARGTGLARGFERRQRDRDARPIETADAAKDKQATGQHGPELPAETTACASPRLTMSKATRIEASRFLHRLPGMVIHRDDLRAVAHGHLVLSST